MGELQWCGLPLDGPRGAEAERIAARDVREVATALAHCHGLGVVHR